MAVENKWTPHLPGVVLLTTGHRKKGLGLLLNMNFGFDFGFDVYALWEKKRPVLSCIFIFILFGFWIMILERKPHWHMTSKGSFAAKKILKRRRRQAAHGSIDITSSLDIFEGLHSNYPNSKLKTQNSKENPGSQLSKFESKETPDSQKSSPIKLLILKKCSFASSFVPFCS